MEYLEQNKAYFDKEFAAGYGHHYPESHVIKLYNRILNARLGVTGGHHEKLLDFGCSTGSNVIYFASKGFDVYGVDISPSAIDRCRVALRETADHFQVIQPLPKRDDKFFGELFDVVLANQVLCYLSEEDFRLRLDSLRHQLRAGGIVIVTMIGDKHYYYPRSTPASDGLRKVVLGPEPEDQCFMRFTESAEHLKRQFAGFEPLYVGHYDINLCDDSGFHYVFVGKRADS